MILLDDWVKEAALRQMEQWQANGLHLKVSVNLSAKRFKHGNFTDHLQEVLGKHPQVNPEDLELELLETDELGNLLDAKKVLDACRELGVRVSLDDFGSGYSSLTYLSNLPLEHRQWVDQLVHYIESSEGDNSRPPELDVRACYFGKWYDHIGKNRFGEIQQVHEIRSAHEQIHAVGCLLVDFKEQGKLQQARAGIPQLLTYRDQLLGLFHEFVLALDELFGQQISTQ